MTTRPGDWVIDPFVGSGTTAAVAHKTDRHWVGIDSGDHLRELAVPRLARIVRGEDPTGITKRVEYKGGGRVTVYEAETSADEP
jgi:adenine-specific DNA-methyltransferase